MNDTHIKFIKSCRNSKRLCTDRALAQAFKKQFPETDIDSGCQYDGRWLGQYALDLTGIKEFDNSSLTKVDLLNLFEQEFKAFGFLLDEVKNC